MLPSCRPTAPGLRPVYNAASDPASGRSGGEPLRPEELGRSWRAAGLDPALETLEPLRITGADPLLPSRYPIGEASAVALGAAALGAARVHRLRGGPEQTVAVDAAESASTLLGFALQRVDSDLDIARYAPPVSALFQAGDGRWIHLHGGFPHLARGTLALLGCGPNADADEIARAVARRGAVEWEDALAERGLCGAAVRSPEEWSRHDQGRALAGAPVVEVMRIDDADAVPAEAAGERPLDGLRVLDLTRVLAGPTCGRTLAMHGAQVLRIGAERMPSIEPFVIETGRGKRNAFLDLDRSEDLATLRRLVSTSDVFCQGYRSGALARRGLTPGELAAMRPGIVSVSINCYGHEGPWSERRGWEQLAQSASGLAATEGGDASPRLIPAAATDYTTGYWAAYGVMVALARRAIEGGSWHVRASLCQTAMWLERLGPHRDPDAATGLGAVGDRLQSCETAWGRLEHLGPAVTMSHTPPRWERPPCPLGTHPPEWLEG